MSRPRPLELVRLDDEELIELEELLEACARGPATVPTGTVAGVHPWERRRADRGLELVTELRTTGARQSRMGNGGGGAAAPAHLRPVPYVATVNELAALVHGALADLTAALMRADAKAAPIGPRRPAPASLHAEDLAAWLLGRLDSLAWQPGIATPHINELRRLIARGRHAIDRRAPRWYAGPCNLALRDDAGDLVIVNGHQARCAADLYVRPHVAIAVCPACRGEHHIAKRRAELLRQAHNRLETATDLSRALAAIGNLECKPARVHQWKARGRIAVRGQDSEGRPLYRVGDALELLEQDATRAERAAAKAKATRKTNKAKAQA